MAVGAEVGFAAAFVIALPPVLGGREALPPLLAHHPDEARVLGGVGRSRVEIAASSVVEWVASSIEARGDVGGRCRRRWVAERRCRLCLQTTQTMPASRVATLKAVLFGSMVMELERQPRAVVA